MIVDAARRVRSVAEDVQKNHPESDTIIRYGWDIVGGFRVIDDSVFLKLTQGKRTLTKSR